MNKNAITAILYSKIPGYEKSEIAVVPEERLMAKYISSTLKKMEDNLRNDLKLRIWIEMAITHTIPEEIQFDVKIKNDIVLNYKIPFKEKYHLTEENPAGLIEDVSTFTNLLAEAIANELPFHIIHSELFKRLNS